MLLLITVVIFIFVRLRQRIWLVFHKRSRWRYYNQNTGTTRLFEQSIGSDRNAPEYQRFTVARRQIYKNMGSCVFCAPPDRYIGRHIDRHSTEVSAAISTDTLPICRSTYRSTLGRYVGWYVDREWLSDCRPTCRSIGYRHSADTAPILVTSLRRRRNLT